MITEKHFGNLSIGEVTAYTLSNNNGLSAEILNLGGILRRLVVNGIDVVLGRETADGCSFDDAYQGALIGRNSNRIENCEFTIGETKYKLDANDSGRDCNLHGGVDGFARRIWDAQAIDGDEPQLILSLFSPDGDQGFPGNAEIKVTYTLTKDSLKIHYEGTADADTIINMTNHSYFNLNGHASGDVLGHKLWIDADFFAPNNDLCVADGSILPVKDTPFDFTSEKAVGKEIHGPIYQLQNFRGYDHNFVINGRGFRRFAELTGDKTGITMVCFTDRPGVQLYTGNFVTADIPCKDSAEYTTHSGLCLETQGFPNAPKYSHFPSTIVKKGEKYDSVTEFKFIQK
ncbi:MAG: galactose mutarotase [Clostridia bacterium]|nr:galactose mutarotase [Clostridia bacterium]